MEIHPDASAYGIGAVLVQTYEGSDRPLCFPSRLLNKAELNYSVTDKECLAVVWAMKKFRFLIWGCEIKIVSDHHASCWLMSKKELGGRLSRWSCFLQGWNPVIVHKNGGLHTDADALSRHPVGAGTEDQDQDGNYEPLWLVRPKKPDQEDELPTTCQLKQS